MSRSCAGTPADPPSVEIHQPAGHQRDQEIDAHRDADDLDRLPGLAQRRAREYRNQVGISDRHRQRRVLGEIEILVGERRQDDAQRLRHDDQPQGRAPRQPKRGAGFHLPLVNRQNAGANDLGDEGAGIGRQRQRQRHEFRNDPRTAGEIESSEHRYFKTDGRAKHERCDKWQSNQQANNIRPDRHHPAALKQLPLRIKSQQQRSHDRNQKRDRNLFKSRMRNWRRNHEPAIGKEKNIEQRNALPGWRKRPEHGEIPEQDLEQERDVAQQFDIATGNSRQQPVRLQPAQRYQESDHRRKEDADNRDQQRVEQTNNEYARIGI